MNASSIFKPLCAAVLSLASLASSAGIYVSGSTIYENNSPFVMKGINVAHTWYADKTSSSLSDIAKTGANTARIVLANGKLWTRTSESDVTSIISQAKANKLIAVLEVHDTTGYGEQTAATLSEAVDYWISIKNSLIGQEDYVIINIGNEPFGNGQSTSAWVNGHKNAVSRLRAAGFKHALMIDGANWGQDWQNIMRDNAASVLASDPNKNLIFSVHMYDVYDTAAKVTSYISTFKSNGLALVVGEYAADHFGKEVNEAAIMSATKDNGYGYIGWSWSGNGSGLTSLDIVQNFNASSLSTWGNTLINGTNGIKATSKTATIFGGSSTSTSSSTNSNSCGTASNGYPYCCNASSATGGGWGWENNASCVVKTSSTSCNWYGTTYPICTNTSSGWGWENNKSCISAATCASQ